MSEPFFTPLRKMLFIGLGAGLVIVIVSVIALTGYLFSQYRSEGSDLPPETNQVIIVSPAFGSEFPLGSPMSITARALGPEPFLSTELWIDGVLAGVDGGPFGGMTPFNSDFRWIPKQPGAHLLVARALDANRSAASSVAVMVVVLPSEEFTQPAAGGGEPGQAAGNDASQGPGAAQSEGQSAGPVVFPSAEQTGQAIQPPAPPAPGTDAGASQPWQGTPGDWLTSLTAQAAPNAPQVVAKADGCSAALSIHDLSNNEEGFRVYRQALNSQAWLEVAKLAAQSQNEWITYADSGVPGPTLYYVSAFNSQGESSGNITIVNVAAANCPPLDEANPMLTVELTGLFPKVNVEQAYCYQSLGGVDWTRWPSLGFFVPGETGFQLKGALTEILLNDPQGQPVFETLDLRLECWGWNAGKLVLLGQFAQTIDPNNVHDLQVGMDGLTAELSVNVRDLNELGFPRQMPVVPFEGDVDDWDPVADWDPFSLLWSDFDLTWPEPEAARMPFIQTWVSYDPAFCTTHLEPAGKWGGKWWLQTEKDWLETYSPCKPFPGFHFGPGGVNPQPYLVWSLLDNTCKAGFNEDCLPMWWWIGYAKANGGKIVFRVKDYFEVNDWAQWIVKNPLRTMWKFDPSSESCPLGQRIFEVQMLAVGLPNSPTLYGPKSKLVKTPCVEPLGNRVTIKVTFETLTLSNVDDGIGDDVLELASKYFGARSTSMTADKVVYIPGGFLEFSNGSFPLSGLLNNNSLLIKVQDGEAIKLTSDITDWDFFDYDPVCVTNTWTKPKTWSQWATTANETYELYNEHDNATCSVNVVLNAVAP